MPAVWDRLLPGALLPSGDIMVEYLEKSVIFKMPAPDTGRFRGRGGCDDPGWLFSHRIDEQLKAAHWCRCCAGRDRSPVLEDRYRKFITSIIGLLSACHYGAIGIYNPDILLS